MNMSDGAAYSLSGSLDRFTKQFGGENKQSLIDALTLNNMLELQKQGLISRQEIIESDAYKRLKGIKEEKKSWFR